MAQSGFTPISLYYSSTASSVPLAANLANGELALNTADMKLYAKNSGGTVTLLASNAATLFNGTVTSVSVVTANGLAGTVATDTTTPAITLSTSVTGVLKGNGTAISAATAGTDYLAPPSGTAILKANSGGALANATAGTDYVAPGTVTTFTAAQSFPASGVLLKGSSTGYTTFTSANASATDYTVTFPAETMTVGYKNIPPVGTKTSSYTLATADVGKYVQIGSGGSIVIPNAVFAEGDVVSVFNNTSGAITITCSITTAYIGGVNTDRASVSLATRGVATILFISSTLCVISGNVS